MKENYLYNNIGRKMEQFIIKGGTKLKGNVEISGAKNAALPILCAAVMADEPVTIENLPDVNDTNVLLSTIASIGGTVKRIDKHTVLVNGSTINKFTIDSEAIRKIRASYYFLGALIGKYKKACVALPGGCTIGARPIDLHLKGFEALGTKCDINNGAVNAKVKHLLGGFVYLDKVSVGATINIMMAATLAKGSTVIENAAKEPHVVDVANLLNSMGANIRGAGTDIIRVRGVEKLHGCTYSVIPDQIEAGTFMMGAAITAGDVTLKNVIPKHLESISSKLVDMGCTIYEGDDSLRVVGAKKLKNTQVITLPYPGFPTDMQPQIATTLAVATGTSVVTESIFENRFKYVSELEKMGAHIRVETNVAIIEGKPELKGAEVYAPDLRAGAALILAGLCAKGVTRVKDIVYILRGYEDFEKKLQQLGAKIVRVNSEKAAKQFILEVC